VTKRTFQIYRYDPDTDAKPRMQTLEVELDGSERMLLDAMMKLKAVDPSLSFRRSCREGVCGSDAMNINGKNGLACLTNMRTLPGTVVLKPLPGLPVVRDLIVDMTQFFKQYNSIKPYLVNDTLPPDKERLQSPELLVEPRQIRRPGRPAAGLPFHCRQPRPGHRSASGQPRRPLPPVPLPHDHELRRCLPEGPEPDQGDRQDQGNDGPPGCLTDPHHGRCRSTQPIEVAQPFVERFFRRHAATLTERNATGLQALMELADPDLLDLFLARQEPQDALDCEAVHEVLRLIRSGSMTERQ
jgi:2Fe-2S iron-sulfur cluster binding domain/Flavinator of succinate dehydrogenase